MMIAATGIAYPRVMGTIDSTAWVAPSAVVTGDVTICPESRVLHGAVIHGDLGPIVYGVPRGTSMREIMLRQCAAFGPGPDGDESSS